MKLMIDIDEENEETLEYIKRDIENAILRHTIAFEIKPYEEKTGHWVQRVCNFYWYKQFVCSECGHEIICHEKTPNYCEKCGADMKGE